MFVYLHVKFQDKKIVYIAEWAGHSQHIAMIGGSNPVF